MGYDNTFPSISRHRKKEKVGTKERKNSKAARTATSPVRGQAEKSGSDVLGSASRSPAPNARGAAPPSALRRASPDTRSIPRKAATSLPRPADTPGLSLPPLTLFVELRVFKWTKGKPCRSYLASSFLSKVWHGSVSEILHFLPECMFVWDRTGERTSPPCVRSH